MIYEKKLQLRIIFSCLLCIIGIIAFSTGIYLLLSTNLKYSAVGYLVGTGTGFTIAGILMAFKNFSTLKNPDKLKVKKIEEQDERNLFISYKAGYYSMIIAVLGMYLAALCFVFVNSAIQITLNSIASYTLLLYCIIYLFLKKVN